MSFLCDLCVLYVQLALHPDFVCAIDLESVAEIKQLGESPRGRRHVPLSVSLDVVPRKEHWWDDQPVAEPSKRRGLEPVAERWSPLSPVSMPWSIRGR